MVGIQWPQMEVRQHFQWETGAWCIVGRRREGRGEPTYALGWCVSRERLRDIIDVEGRDGVRQYMRELKEKMWAIVRTAPEQLPEKPECSLVYLQEPPR